MAVEQGTKKSKVPFPQFDKPGSKISPFTGKPYTNVEKARVHSNTVKRDQRLDAVRRRIAEKQGRPKQGDGRSQLGYDLKVIGSKLPKVGFASRASADYDKKRAEKPSLSEQFKKDKSAGTSGFFKNLEDRLPKTAARSNNEDALKRRIEQAKKNRSKGKAGVQEY